MDERIKVHENGQNGHEKRTEKRTKWTKGAKRTKNRQNGRKFTNKIDGLNGPKMVKWTKAC